MKTALITGIGGQDGAFLAAELISLGYRVIGAGRRGGATKFSRLDTLNIADKVQIIPLEIADMSNVLHVMSDHRPDLIFNFAAQSFVQDSYSHPTLTTQINYLGVLNLLEAIRILKLDARFFQASSSEIFGNSKSKVQDESTRLQPISPYAISKCAAHLLVGSYREVYGMHASSGILFNHESELRGREFVTRKITCQMAELVLGRSKPIELGNFNSARDWGYAKDYVKGMALIIEADVGDDFVLATKTSTTVREFFTASALAAGFDPIFEGEGVNEVCIDKLSGKLLCVVNEKFYRTADIISPLGDPGKIKNVLGWSAKTSVSDMATIMVKSDIATLNGSSK